MDTMEEFQSITNGVEVVKLIIPTVMIPLTAVSILLSVVATFIAGLFGIQLKAEGPRRLLEVLLKPKVLAWAFVGNFLILGGIWAYKYVSHLPVFEWKIKKTQAEFSKESSLTYEDVIRRKMKFSRSHAQPQISKTDHDFKVEWKTTLPKGPFRAPARSSGSLFTASVDGHVYEIAEKDGELLRKFYVGTFVSPAPIIHGGKLYLGEGTHHTHHARIYQYDLKTATLLKTYETKGHTEGTPVIGFDEGSPLLFAPSGSDGLHAIDLSTMERRWRVFDGHIDASVFVEDGTVFTGTGREKGDSSKHRSYAVAYQIKDGTKIWQKELPASSWMSPVSWKDDICFVYGEVYFVSGIGGVNCYNKKTGEPGSSFNMAAPVVGMPMIVDDWLLVSDVNGRACSFDLEKRRKMWCREFESKGKSFASAIYDPFRHVVAIATKQQGFHLLDPVNGETLLKWEGIKDQSEEAVKDEERTEGQKEKGKEKLTSEKPSSGEISTAKPSSTKTSYGPYYAGAIPLQDGFIIADLKGNVKKLTLTKK